MILASKVLVRRLVNDSSGRPKYTADLATMRRLITKGPRNAGAGMRFMSLRKKYPKEYAELKAEAQGQVELL